MKKIIILAIFTTLLSEGKSQGKSGILKKDYYGTFSGDQWEEFLAGKNASAFESKSNISLANYRGMMQAHVQKTLGESTIESAVANSTVQSIPLGTIVHTFRSDGTPLDRQAYPGEQGFFHTGTNKFWLSFSCGNPCDVTMQGPPVKSVPASIPAASNNQQLVVNNGGIDYATYALGQRDMANIEDHDILKMQQMKDILASNGNSGNTACCNTGVGSPSFSNNTVQQQTQCCVPTQQTVVQQGDGMTTGKIILGTAVGTTIGTVAGNFFSDLLRGRGRQQQQQQNVFWQQGTVQNYPVQNPSVGYNYSNLDAPQQQFVNTSHAAEQNTSTLSHYVAKNYASNNSGGYKRRG